MSSVVFEFNRYVRRQKKAEGCRIEKESSFQIAQRKAWLLFEHDAPESKFKRRCPVCRSDDGDVESLEMDGIVSFVCFPCGHHQLSYK